MIQLYHGCPSFEVCSCNICPLDPDFELKEALSGEERCRAHKTTRTRIANRYPGLLKYDGLTPREWAGFRFWSGLSENQKEIVRNRLKANFLQEAKQNCKNAQKQPL